MPEKKTMQRVAEHKRKGHRSSTQASEFVREEMHHKRRGKHAVKNRKQAIAIGLSKARRSGVRIPKNPKNKGRGRRTRSR